MKKYLVFISVFLIGFIEHISAEGSKELEPSARVGFQTKFQFGSDKITNFATFSSDTSKRVYIHISDPANEKIYLGFGAQFDNDNRQDPNPINGYYRVKNSNGIIIHPANGDALPIPKSGQGFIPNKQQAISPPQGLNGGANGYDPIIIDPSPGVSGDYYIEFSRTNSANDERRVRLEYFDITVGNQTTKNPIKGRLWAYMWSLVCPPSGEVFKSEASFYTYTRDSVVTQFNLNGIDPMGFAVMCNELGTNTSTDFVQSRRSIGGAQSRAYPQFKIFLNDPDISAYPSYKTELFLEEAYYNGCNTNQTCKGITMKLTKSANVEILIDLDGITGYNPGGRDVFITAKLKAGFNCVPWDGKDALGGALTGQTVGLSAKIYNGLTNFPIFDPENNATGLIVKSVRPKNPGAILPVFWDDSRVNNPSPNTPFNVQSCIANPPQGCHTWNNNFGNDVTINSWWYGSELQVDKQLLIDPIPVAHAYVNDLFPCNTNLILDIGNLNPPPNTDYKYEWLPLSANANMAAIDNKDILRTKLNLNSISPLAGGDSIKYELVVNNLGCIARDSLTVKIKPTTNISILGKDEVCPNTQNVNYWVLINDNEPRTVIWKNLQNTTQNGAPQGDSIKLNFANVPASFEVEINYADPTCPKPTATKSVNIVPTPQADKPIGKSDFCIKNESIATYTVSSVNGATYAWSLSDPTKGNFISATNTNRVQVEWSPIPANSTSETVDLQINQTYNYVDGSGVPQVCNVSQNELTIILRDPIKGSPMTDVTVCNEVEANLAYNEFATNPSQARYIWSPNTGFVSNIDVYNPRLNLSTLDGDVYNYNLTVIKDGCTHKDDVRVTVNPDARIESMNGPNPVCIFDQNTPYSVVASHASSYSWQVQGAASNTPNGSDLTVNWDTTQAVSFVQATAISQYGCKNDVFRYPIQVVYYKNPKPTGDSTLCAGLPLTIGYEASANNDLGEPYTWAVRPAQLGAVINNLASSDTVSVTYSQAGIYYISALQTRANMSPRCFVNDSLKVIVTLQANINVLSDQTICEKDTATLSIEGNTSNANFRWYNKAFPSVKIDSPNYLVSPKASATPYEYVAELIDPNCIAKDSALVMVNPLPAIGFVNKNIEFCFEDNATLNLEGPAAMTSYDWQPMAQNTQNVSINQNTFSDNFEKRYIRLEIKDAQGCINKDSVLLSTICDPRLFLPKSFSPNDDGYNDSLQWFGAHYTNFQILIFNRWGEVIFETKDKSKLWDGTYRGVPVEPGVYPWILSYESLRPKDPKNPRKQEGSITIVK